MFCGLLPVAFRANLKVENNKLVAVRVEGQEDRTAGEEICGRARRALRPDAPGRAVDFYIAERARSPLPLKPGQELWIEVTVPPKGPPRPLQLALKQDGAWKPLAF